MEPTIESEEQPLESERIKSEAERFFSEFQQALVQIPEFQVAAAKSIFTREPPEFLKDGMNYRVGFDSEHGIFNISRWRGDIEDKFNEPPEVTERVSIALLDKAGYMFQEEVKRASSDPENTLVFSEHLERLNEPNYLGFSGPDFYNVELIGKGKHQFYSPRKNTPTVIQRIEKVLSDLKSNPQS